MKNAAIAILLALVVWLAATVERLENYHYANFSGLCSQPGNSLLNRWKQDECLRKVETRTSGLWHLFYALKNDY